MVDRLSQILNYQLLKSPRVMLQKDVSAEEIKAAMFSLSGEKVTGLDVFNAHFFKSGWPIIGEEVMEAVQGLFVSCKLIREANATILTLVQSPSKLTVFQPIVCCNTIHKCITKILSERLKLGLNDFVSPCQTAFIPGRKIYNISWLQKLVKDYHKNRKPHR
jgi:hypothetical protein